MTKELTASAPSVIKIEVVTPPGNIVLTVGSVDYGTELTTAVIDEDKTNDNILTVGAKRFRHAKALFLPIFMVKEPAVSTTLLSSTTRSVTLICSNANVVLSSEGS